MLGMSISPEPAQRAVLAQRRENTDWRAAYEAPQTPWLRLNFVATVDGSVQGADGVSRSINNEADQQVFATLRDLADVIVVGAGTVRAEGYEPNPKPFVVVTRSGAVPPSLREGDLSQVYVATGADAPQLAQTRDLLGEPNVLVTGQQGPDLAALRRALEDRGFGDILCEGGPALAADLVAAGLVNELCLTMVPTLVAGDGLRVLSGAPIDVPLRLHQLVEYDGTLLTRWWVSPREQASTGSTSAY